MYENPYAFNSELDAFLAMDITSAEALEFWHLLEARYPSCLIGLPGILISRLRLSEASGLASALIISKAGA